MALTEKGKIALSYVEKYFPNGESFCAKELSDKSGEKIYAATLNGVVNEGFLIKIGGSPVEYKAVSGLKDMIGSLSSEKDKKDNASLVDKIITIVPEMSLIGMIMNDMGNTLIIESDSYLIHQHNVFCWKINEYISKFIYRKNEQ